jgi:hypothetical protein
VIFMHPPADLRGSDLHVSGRVFFVLRGQGTKITKNPMHLRA